MDRCWILLGMMGAGKSSVGRALAEASQRAFQDTDLLLQHRFGRPVHQIFALYGEEAFRCHETSVLRSLDPSPIVLATGGGIVMRPENWAEFRRLGTTVYLDVEERVLIERLGRSKKRRPLLMADDWEGRVSTILAARRPLYEQADVKVSIADEEIGLIADRVMREIGGP